MLQGGIAEESDNFNLPGRKRGGKRRNGRIGGRDKESAEQGKG